MQKVNTCLDIIQDYTARCPEGIYSLWPWETWSEQHICDVKKENVMRPEDASICYLLVSDTLCHFRRICWIKSRYLQKSWLHLHLSLSLGLMATREPRSQIAPNWPAMELFKLTKGVFSSGLRVHQHGNAQQIIHLPGEVEQVTLVEGDVPIWALSEKQQSGLIPVPSYFALGYCSFCHVFPHPPWKLWLPVWRELVPQRRSCYCPQKNL